MNDFKVIFEGGNVSESGSALKLLNVYNDEEFIIRHGFSDFSRLKRPFSAIALDLVYLALSAYGCDRAISRDEADDRWTRTIFLTLPVHDLDRWRALESQISHLLSFLTGDVWVIKFTSRNVRIFNEQFTKEQNKWRKRSQVTGNVTCLFSGGLDSFIGAIDWLEKNPNRTLTLSGAYDPHAEGAAGDQNRLYSVLQKAYPNRSKLFTSRMGIEGKGKENSYRSRSFCFIAFGILASTFQSAGSTVLIPENGSIALNYPLSPARYGSSSTRTVHPYFLSVLQLIITDLGLGVELLNPYQLLTKGEVLSNCQNPNLLRESYALSVSCGNRKRFKTLIPPTSANQCGFCVPCIFRRAALFSVGLDNETFGAQVEDPSTWGSAKINEPNKHFSDVCDFVRANESDRVIKRRIIANGRLNPAQIQDFVELVKRQRLELHRWLTGIGVL